MQLPKNIEALGKILAFGFGPDVLKGFIPAYLAKIPIDSCIEYITTNRDLLSNVSDNDWLILRKISQAAKIDISRQYIMDQLLKSRPDLWAIIYNTPGGIEWLDQQVTNCKAKLALR